MKRGQIANLALIILGVGFLSNLLFGCSSQEMIPFKDGDFFEYQYVKGERAPSKDIYKITEMGFKKYKVTLYSGNEEKKVLDMIVNIAGKIEKVVFYDESARQNLFNGKQISLWLPTSKRVKGQTVNLSGFVKDNRISGEREWSSWDVWIVRYTSVFGWHEMFYDKETGFFVGHKDSSKNVSVLVDSSMKL